MEQHFPLEQNKLKICSNKQNEMVNSPTYYKQNKIKKCNKKKWIHTCNPMGDEAGGITCVFRYLDKSAWNFISKSF